MDICHIFLVFCIQQLISSGFGCTSPSRSPLPPTLPLTLTDTHHRWPSPSILHSRRNSGHALSCSWARSSGRQRVVDPRVDLYAVCSVAPCKHAEIEARSARRSPLPHPPRPGFGSRALGRARYGRLDSVARARSQRLSSGFSCYDLEVVRGEGQPACVSHPRRLTGELGAGVEIGHALRR